MNAENGYSFSNECYQYTNQYNAGFDLPRDVFDREWAKINSDSQGMSTWEDVWAKSLKDGRENGMIQDDQTESIMDTIMQEQAQNDPAEASKKIMAEFESDLKDLDAGIEQEMERQTQNLQQKVASRK